MYKVVVIGGAGSIGSNLVDKLLTEGHEVAVLDNMSSGNQFNLRSNSNFSYCDVRDREKLEDILISINPDYIYNLSAHFANQNSVDYPYTDTEVNVFGVINILNACKNLTELKKYIYTSSSCVYGNSAFMSESDFIYPHETPYAINKYVGELYSKYFATEFGIPTVSVRVFNTYGEGEIAGAYRNVIPNFIDKAIKGEDLVITGDGQEVRDFTYVKDTVDCLILAAKSNYIHGEVFNAGTGVGVKISNLAESIIRLVNSRSSIIYTKRRSWDNVTSRISNIEKSKELLGYDINYNLESGLIRTISWYKDISLSIKK